jgi:hypothetical protein
MSSNKNEDIQAAIAAIFFGGTLVFSGLRRHRRARKTADAAQIPIASAPQGQVEIQGFAWPKQGTYQTLDGRTAVFHRLVLEKLVSSGKKSKWVQEWRREMAKPFYVLDSTGLVEVNPESAELEVKTDNRDYRSLPDPCLQQIDTYGIQVSGFPPMKGFFGWSGKYRFCETAILIGAPVYLYGSLSTKQPRVSLPPTQSLQRFRDFLGRMKGRRISQNSTFDRNKDGFVCDEEAILATNAVGEQSLAKKPHFNEQPAILPGQTRPENIVYGEVASCPERKLFIADCHEEHLLRRIGSNNILRIVGGALLVGGGVFYLMWRAGLR